MKLIASLLIVLLLMSCGKRKAPVISVDKESLSENQIDSILLENNYAYGEPITVDSAAQLLIPLVLKRKGQSKRSFSKYDSNRGANEIWNVIFYNQNTEATSLLGEEIMKIARIYTRPTGQSKNTLTDFDKIFYEMRMKDYNADEEVDHKDPLGLFTSEIDGSALTRISPENEHLSSFRFLGSTASLFIKTRRDTNGDLLFNDHDDSVLYKATYANNKWSLKEVVSQSLNDKIDNLYFDQWLNEK